MVYSAVVVSAVWFVENCQTVEEDVFFALFPFINVLSQYVDDRDGSVEVAILGENWRRLLQ